jgi:hypothetical protein
MPGARVMSVPFSSCWPSLRLMWSAKGLKAPALGLAGPALKPGANGRVAIVFAQAPPPGALAREKGSEGVAAGLPDQGVNRVPVVFGPQVGGLLRTARAPSSKSSSTKVNGTCGFSAKVVVS